MKAFMVALFVSSAVAFVGGCSQSTVTDPNTIVFPDSLVSYRNHVQPFMTLRCGQCHGETVAAGNIRLTQYSYLLFDRPNLVVPGAPDESLVVQVLERIIAHPSGQFETISANHIRGVRKWIAEGAENN